jgi:hypothetical protein
LGFCDLDCTIYKSFYTRSKEISYVESIIESTNLFEVLCEINPMFLENPHHKLGREEVFF